MAQVTFGIVEIHFSAVFMRKVNQKLETLGNILIVIVSILLIGIIVQKYFLPSQNSSQGNFLTVKSKVPLDNVEWSKSNKNLLLILQKGCRFCSESASFYKTLIEQAKGKGINIIAILPQDKATAEEYLKSLGVSGIEIMQSDSSSLFAEGTPAVVLVDNQGRISNLWIGKLPFDKEREVINELIS